MKKFPKNISKLKKYFKSLGLDVVIDNLDIKHTPSDFAKFGISPHMDTFTIVIKATGHHKNKD